MVEWGMGRPCSTNLLSKGNPSLENQKLIFVFVLFICLSRLEYRTEHPWKNLPSRLSQCMCVQVAKIEGSLISYDQCSEKMCDMPKEINFIELVKFFKIK